MDRKIGAKPIIIGILVVVLLAASYVIYNTVFASIRKVTINQNSFNVKLIANESDRAKFLVGGLDDGDDKILLAFPTDDDYSISMKNITKPIDILWLDSDKNIIQIVKNTNQKVGSQESYKSKKPAKYIIELPSGFVDQNQIKVDQVADFQVNSEDIK